MTAEHQNDFENTKKFKTELVETDYGDRELVIAKKSNTPKTG